MKDALPKEIRLDDYLAPNYLIDTTQLHFELGEVGTLVKSTLKMRLNPDAQNEHAEASKPMPLELQGVDLELKRIAIDGKNLQPDEYEINGELLKIDSVPDAFQLECVTLLRPQLNTSLEGLYKSNTMFCTQCEAEGFRKITYYLDRPDVMSIFTTTISADKDKYPVLLSNGNDIERGESGTKHWVTWHDPFKKPAYLFALVAGNLVHQEDSFTTMSGRAIQLQIFVEKENYDKCDHAMASLKHAMKWDEDVYGREYDLDKFMIVAVNDFNMGAMENKGLNIFNSSCVLAKPETATDFAYQRIEAVVAHEYFHNWSGNRVTCRDWFQLSLKEGFTVFRDQEFSADMGSRAVKRIDDVSLLRTVQFAQDDGPMAHPVRPAVYLEISNFYTVTIYEKGAEVVRMIRTLLGKEHFRKGCDLYFQRHDGQAVTTDDFVAAMESASGKDLTRFKRWYSQAGTPVLTVTDRYDEVTRQYHLDVEQCTPDTPGQTDKLPLHIPLAIGLIDNEGNDLVNQVLELKDEKQTFVFEGINEKPVPSLLRGFSAPVKLNYPYTADELVFLIRHDQDGFNRWNACQTLAINIIRENAEAYRMGQPMKVDSKLISSYRFLLGNPDLDKAMLARMLMMPSEAYLAELAEQIDVEAIHVARQYVRKQMASELQGELLDCYQGNQFDGAYAFNGDAVAQRSLKNICLHYLMLLDDQQMLELSLDQFRSSNNMTDTHSALNAIVHSRFLDKKERVLADFYQQWQHDPLVVDQWFSVQASNPLAESFARVQALLQHPAFDIKNPNKVRSLIGVFCNQNAVNFHRKDGAGYAFLADKIIELDKMNPQIAARLVTPLTTWRQHIPESGKKMQAQLERIKAQRDLSNDVFEVVTKSLN